MSAWRTAGITRRPLPSHAAYIGLWTLVLVVASYLRGGAGWPWVLTVGLLPILVGFALFLLRKNEEPLRWLVLIAGEALGVILGSVLVAGPASPLLLLALWPVAWAALELSHVTGLGLISGMVVIYLGAALWQVLRGSELGMAILSMVLYLGAFYGVFFLLRSPEQAAQQNEPVAQAALSLPTPPATAVTEAPPAPRVDDALHQDLQVARDIQVSLLLASSPRLPGWEASTSFLPARELGGDLYDFVELDPQHWGIMIGDVSGKGIPAALHMAVARTLFRMEARHCSDPVQTLARVNESLIEQVPQGCVTLLYASLDITDGSLRLANAGHNYPFILDQTAREVALDGLPLGIDRDYTFSEAKARLMPGDVLVLYTDGVVEAVNEEGEVFGFDRLRGLLAESNVRRPRTLTRQIVRAVRAFTGPTPQNDDITLVVLRRRFQDRVREMAEVARDVLGPEGGQATSEQLQALHLPPDASGEACRAAILSLSSSLRERWGHGLARELMQQLFLTLEGL